MKPIFALFIVFPLLLSANLSYARKDLGEYWKNVMKGQPMPEAIKNLLAQDPSSVSDSGKDLFIRDFDTRPNVIIYHTHVHVVSQKQKPFEPEHKMKFKEQEALVEHSKNKLSNTIEAPSIF